MDKHYQCKKCGTVYKDEQSEGFVKTTLRKCPSCGSTEVRQITAMGNYKKTVAKSS